MHSVFPTAYRVAGAENPVHIHGHKGKASHVYGFLFDKFDGAHKNFKLAVFAYYHAMAEYATHGGHRL